MTDAGLAMTLNKKGDSITAQTSFYIFWGEVEVQFQAAPGQGIISTVNLLSDDLDEIGTPATILQRVQSDTYQTIEYRH